MLTNPSATEDLSAEVASLATIAVLHAVIDHLIEREIMTDQEATELFAKAASGQRCVDLPGNQQAAALLDDIATERARKFRSAVAPARDLGQS